MQQENKDSWSHETSLNDFQEEKCYYFHVTPIWDFMQYQPQTKLLGYLES